MTIKPIRTMINHSTTEVFFDNVRVPAENLIGEEGKGFRYILSGMNAERILIAAECIGDAKWLIEKASNYAKDRVVFGRPIGQNQGIQFPITKAYAHMRAAELMVHRAAQLFENNLRTLSLICAMSSSVLMLLNSKWPRCSPPRRYGIAAEACALATQALRKLLDGVGGERSPAETPRRGSRFPH